MGAPPKTCMDYVALRPFVYRDARGRRLDVKSGDIVDVMNRQESERLNNAGLISEYDPLSNAPDKRAKMAAGRRRVLFWFSSTPFYSGGRVHAYQAAWCMARMGNDVLVMAEDDIKWSRDYPSLPNLRTITGPPNRTPDVDLVIADGKGKPLECASAWALKRGIPLVAWNFETPNWVAEFDKNEAGHIAGQKRYRGTLGKADLIVCNSTESAKYLRAWLPGVVRTAVLPPAVNTTGEPADIPDALQGRAYALVCGRGARYKRQDLAARVVRGYDGQLDLVCVGQWRAKFRESDRHRLHIFRGVPDALKFGLMQGARLVMHPSTFEGYGMVPIESAASGTRSLIFDLPVSVENYGDLVETVPRGEDDAYVVRAHEMIAENQPLDTEHTALARGRHGMDAMTRTLETMPYHTTREVRLSAVMNVYANASTVKYALDSVYDDVDEIAISYGRDECYDWSPDGTLEILRAYPDPAGKITIDARDVWKGKTKEQSRQAMRKSACSRVTGNYLMILDSDELWVGLGRMKAAIRDGRITGGVPLAVTFWHDRHHWIREAKLRRWGYTPPAIGWGCVWPHTRIIPWRASYAWPHHVVPKTHGGDHVWPARANVKTVDTLGASCVLYHLGHALTSGKMAQKKDFYKTVHGHTKQEAAFLRWDGTLGECGDGIVEAWTRDLPPVVAAAFDNIEALNGE